MRQFLFVLFFLCCAAANAQMPLDSFFRIGAVWTEHDDAAYGHGMYDGNGYRLRILRDSSINGKTYHLLDKTAIGGYSRYDRPGPNPAIYYHVRNIFYGTIAALRTSGKKVYVVNLDTGNHNPQLPFGRDTLLYDFDLHVGDVVARKPQYHDTVLSIDSVLLSNGRYMRRYQFTNNHEDWWCEGTGSFLGVLGAYDNYYNPVVLNRFYRFLCYDNGSFSYHEQAAHTIQPLDSTCYSEAVLRMLDVPDAATGPGDATRLYPVPSRPSQQVTIENGTRMIRSVTVVDAQGRKVCEYRNIDAHTFRVSLPPPPGMYEVAVTYDDRVVRGRMLVRE